MENYIKGKIVVLMFENDNSFKIGKMKVRESSNGEERLYLNRSLVFKGNFPNLSTDLTYIFYGRTIPSIRNKHEFIVTSYKSILPSTKDSLIAFLSSDIFKGIGYKTAKDIVDIFGVNTIKEIEKENPLLYEIKGMNKRKATNLIDKIKEYSLSEELILKLTKLTFTNEESLKIITKHKDKSLDIVKNNIYSLIDLVSFPKLDSVFLKMYKEDDILRIKNLIPYLIKTICYETGDTLLYKDKLYNSMQPYFKTMISYDYYIEVINTLLHDYTLIEYNDLITTKEFYKTELSISSTIKKLNKQNKSIKKEDIYKRINTYETKNKITFNNEQKEAIYNSLSNNFYIITGGPGTGKTTIIKAIVDIYEDMNFNTEKKDITLLAPTGRASKRINESVKRDASTIHKFLKWNKETREFNINEKNPSDTKLVIVDEFSMVDIFLFDSLLKALTNNVKLLLVGDKNQLPSISPGNVLTDLLSVNSINKSSLEQVYRTSADSYIIPLASQIKNKIPFSEVPKKTKDFCFVNTLDINVNNYLRKIITHAKENKVNLDEFQVLLPKYKGTNGIDQINRLMQKTFNPPSPFKAELFTHDTLYREGDKVLQTVNDVDNNIYNGDVGYIKKIIPGKDPEMFIDYNNNVVQYKRSKFEEIQLAYAITIHKSQGSEYKNVLLAFDSSMTNMLYNKLVYTAVTRAKEGLVIVSNLSNFNQSILSKKDETRNTLLSTFF